MLSFSVSRACRRRYAQDKLPFGCVPLLEIDGLNMVGASLRTLSDSRACLVWQVQTNAIVRYIATRHGLGADPSQPWQAALIDMAEGG